MLPVRTAAYGLLEDALTIKLWVSPMASTPLVAGLPEAQLSQPSDKTARQFNPFVTVNED